MRLAPPGEEPMRDGLAAWVVDRVDAVWERLGCPDPFSVASVSGDDGRLAREVLHLGPACLEALRWILVHPQVSPGHLAAVAGEVLPLEEPSFLYPARRRSPEGAVSFEEFEQWDDSDSVDEAELPPAVGVGPLTTVLGDLPVLGDDGSGSAGMVMAVGVLSRLEADRLEWGDEGWREVMLVADPGGGDALEEVLVALAPERASLVSAALGSPPAGGPGRYALHTGAEAWLRRALAAAPRGEVVVVDGWAAASTPLEAVAAPVLALDQLGRVRRPAAGPEPLGEVGDGDRAWSVVTWRIG